MFTRTVILAGTVVIRGVAFRWVVTDGVTQHITVSHPTIGMETQPLTMSPESQALAVGRAMLEGKALEPSIGCTEVVDRSLH